MLSTVFVCQSVFLRSKCSIIYSLCCLCSLQCNYSKTDDGQSFSFRSFIWTLIWKNCALKSKLRSSWIALKHLLPMEDPVIL